MAGQSRLKLFEISCVSTTASPTVLFIFQLPAIKGLRDIVFPFHSREAFKHIPDFETFSTMRAGRATGSARSMRTVTSPVDC